MEDIAQTAPQPAAQPATAALPASEPEMAFETQAADASAAVALDDDAAPRGPKSFPTATADKIREAFESGRYPYARPMGRAPYEAEKARLQKALEVSAKEAKSLEGRLNNAAFVEKAKPEAVDKARADHAHHVGEVELLTAALARLG